MKLRAVASRLAALLRTRDLDRELEAEILAHLELAERDAIAGGLTPEEAQRAARRAFGGVERTKEHHRDQRGVRWMENLSRDFRYGLASLGRAPGFAAVAIGLLALGIGANAAVFSVLDAVLLKPLPFPEPERMVTVWETPPHSLPNPTTTLTFLDWKRQEGVFEALSVECPVRAAVGTGGDVERLPGKLVSADYFRVFDVPARIGRTFSPGEDQPGAAPVVVLSHSFWQARFGALPGILGRDLRLDGVPHRIVGVLPPGSFDRDQVMFWKPLVFAPDQLNREQHWLRVIGRLQPGVSLERAQARMDALRASLAPTMPPWKKDWGFAVFPFAQHLVGDTLRRSIGVAFGAVLLVLLIACANVANLLMARGASRRKEMGLRAALGASRGRLIAQLLTENLVLCLLGGAAGVLVAYGLLRAAALLMRPSLPFTAAPSLDLRALGCAAAATMAVLVLVGLLPSLQTSRLQQALKQTGRGSSGSNARLLRAIVVGEVAVSVMLTSGALLLLKSLARLQRVDPGVKIERVVTMAADLPSPAYASPESAVRFYDAVTEGLRNVPGVEQASVALKVPLEGEGWGESISVPGMAGEVPHIGLKMVDPGYFATLEIPVLSGRGIEGGDRAGRRDVVVVNQEAARQLAQAFGMAKPLGRVVRIPVPGYGPVPESERDVEIVGVIRSEHTGGLQWRPGPMAYMALAQVPQQNIKLVVRTGGEPLAAVSGIREAVRRLDRDVPLGDVRTMEQVKEQSLLWASQPAWVVGTLAGVAALLAALGIYGVLAHAVTQQRREIGIRMALGARRGRVVSHVMWSVLCMLIVGLAVGLAGASALTRVLRSLLFETSAFDPVVLAGACFLMALAGMVAGSIPAARATKLDPVTVLRDDG